MKVLPICLMLMSLIIASHPVGAADKEPLGLLPEAPRLNKPLFVYRDDGVTDKDKTKDAQYSWLAFHGSRQLDAKKDFDSNGEWLKVHSAQAGTYTFVLTCKHANAKEDRWARTVELQKEEPPRPSSKTAAIPKPPKRSAIEKTVASGARAIIVELRPSAVRLDGSPPTLNNSSSSTGQSPLNRQLALASALEDIARLAVQEGWDTSRIVKETKIRWVKVSDRGIDDFEWELLERLLKEVALQFRDTSIEESSADAILALAALATALREDALPPRREVLQQVQPLQLLESSAAYTMTPCRERTRFFRR